MDGQIRLGASDLTLRYDRETIVAGLDVAIPAGSFTVIVGANGCGKSTLLRGLSRMLRPAGGTVLLNGGDIRTLPTKTLARQLGLLPQNPPTPSGITVADLVARGRYPHQRLFRQWSKEDERVVADAMAATGVAELANRPLDRLSGGQRQRAWLALALAQQSATLLLDEPTSFLDIAHAVEVLDLCADLHGQQGRTLVAVLHDLNHACRYATHLIAMAHGRIVAQGVPGEIVTEDLVAEVFGLPVRVIDDPETGRPLVVPRVRATTPARASSAPTPVPAASPSDAA